MHLESDMKGIEIMQCTAFKKYIYRFTSIMSFMFMFKDALGKVLWPLCPQAIWFSLSTPQD